MLIWDRLGWLAGLAAWLHGCRMAAAWLQDGCMMAAWLAGWLDLDLGLGLSWVSG